MTKANCDACYNRQGVQCGILFIVILYAACQSCDLTVPFKILKLCAATVYNILCRSV